jgi:sporulation protein YqfC
MKKAMSLWNKLSFVADLADEPIPGLPLIEIIDNCRVLIENHKGVSEYGTNRIRIKVKWGCICICGENLVLARMDRGLLIVSGIIDSVQLCRG